MMHSRPNRTVLLLVVAAFMLSLSATACKKKKKDAPEEIEEPPATRVEDDFQPPKPDEGDVLSKDLREITERYLHDIHFDFDKAEIRSDAKPVLEENAAFLKKYPSIKIVIEGHCDERGSVEYNLALGERRAKAAKSYLATLGVASDRMTTVSYGKELPLDPGHTEAAWARNRRAHFVAVAK